MPLELFADIKSEDRHKIMPYLINVFIYTTPDNFYSRDNSDGKTMISEIGAIKLGSDCFLRIRVVDMSKPKTND